MKNNKLAYILLAVLGVIAVAAIVLLVLQPFGAGNGPSSDGPDQPSVPDVGDPDTDAPGTDDPDGGDEPDAGDNDPVEDNGMKQVEQYNYVLGTQAFKPGYQFTDETAEMEIGGRIAEMGSNMIKFEAKDDQMIDALMDEYHFSHVFMWYRSINWFRDGYSEDEAVEDYVAIYNYTKKLLTKYNGTGANFYIGHWEGDWYYLGSYDYSVVHVDDVVTQGMIEWMNTRQKAVDDAKRDTPHENVYVWNYIELNRPTEVLDDPEYDRIVNRVLPHINVDYVSYSAYDSMNRSAEEVKATIDLIYANLQDKEGVPGPRVFVGEVGQPQISTYADVDFHCEHNLKNIAKFLACDVKFVLYWQVYDNEGSAFWLINPRNEKLPLYYAFSSILEKGKDYVQFFLEENGRVPTNEEYRAYLLTLSEFK